MQREKAKSYTTIKKQLKIKIMKNYIYIIVLFICFIGYGQQNEPVNLKGDFNITKIDSLKHYYIISAINKDSLFIKILVDKPKKKVIKNLKKNSDYLKIEFNKSYYFTLDSMTWSMGYLPTENIIMEDIVIWNRKTSNFYMYETNQLHGLYLKKSE